MWGAHAQVAGWGTTVIQFAILGFELVGLLLLVNLLIAMMASHYEHSRARSQIDWRLHITRLTLRLELYLPFLEPGVGPRTFL